jgi:hypothetical protein
MTSSPVLFLVFNRPATTALVMDAIRAARPARLYIAGDGPRDRPEEAERCEDARRIATAVDWPCSVQTLFRSRNLGLREAVSNAITWFFENEEEGIILEDDCVPCSTFFPYCTELLERYRDDRRVMAISGDNLQRGKEVNQYSYYFSKHAHSWGWATWRRAWALYDRNMDLWPEVRNAGILKAWSDGYEIFEHYWTRIFDDVASGTINSWGYCFIFSCWAQSGLTCLPRSNLVTNIGFGPEATHTKNPDSWQSRMPVFDLEFPLRHPPFVCRNVDADSREAIDEYLPSLRKRAASPVERMARAALRRALLGPLAKLRSSYIPSSYFRGKPRS